MALKVLCLKQTPGPVLPVCGAEAQSPALRHCLLPSCLSGLPVRTCAHGRTLCVRWGAPHRFPAVFGLQLGSWEAR